MVFTKKTFNLDKVLKEDNKIMKKTVLILLFGLILSANESYYDKGVLVNLESAKESRSLEANLKYFKTKSGKRVGVRDEILVKCKASIDCIELLKRYKQTQITQLTSTIYKVKVKTDELFSLSRELFESGDVEFAHPSFTKEVQKR